MSLAAWQFKNKEDGLVATCLKVVVEEKEADKAEKNAGKKNNVNSKEQATPSSEEATPANDEKSSASAQARKQV
jgi:hypothetical protein